MGNQSIVGVGNGGDSTISLSGYPATVYSPIGGISPVDSKTTTTTYTETICRGTMTLSQMSLAINQITGAGNVSLTANVNIAGAAGQQACALTNHPNTSIAFTVVDTSHSDPISDGTAYGLMFSGIAITSGTPVGIVLPSVSWEQVGATFNYTTMTMWAGNSFALTTSSNKFTTLMGPLNFQLSEPNEKFTFPFGVTLEKAQALTDSNTRTGVAVVSRINGVTGQINVAIGSSSGLTEDTSHSDPVAAGSTANYMIISTGGTTTSFDQLNIRVTSASPNVCGLYAASYNPLPCSVSPSYFPFLGDSRSDTVLGEVVSTAPYGGTLSNMTFTAPTNTSTTTYTVNTMLGAVGALVAGQQTVSFTAGVPGTLTDTSHSDPISAGQQFVLKGSGASASSTFFTGGQAIQFTAPGATPPKDGMLLMGVG